MLPLFEFNIKYFLDRTTVLYGPSESGKSFIIKDILYHLKPHVGQIVVFAPTDPQNHSYSGGLVPLPFIHTDVDPQILSNLWERQSALSAVYKKANNVDVLRRLFDRVADDNTKRIIEQMESRIRAHERGAAEAGSATTISETKKVFEEFRLAVWKRTITQNAKRLKAIGGLSPDEAYTLKYHRLNPRLVLIFDDCTDPLSRMKRNEIINKLFYEGRWNYITAIFACHTDKTLDTQIKKNAFVSIFTDKPTASAYFDRSSTNLDVESKRVARSALNSVFNGSEENKWVKLAWVRSETKFYRLLASPRENFRFGSDCIWRFCEKIKTTQQSKIAGNKYIGEFGL